MFRTVFLCLAVVTATFLSSSPTAEARGCYRGGGYYSAYPGYYGGRSYYGYRHYYGPQVRRSYYGYGPSYGYYPRSRSGVSFMIGF